MVFNVLILDRVPRAACSESPAPSRTRIPPTASGNEIDPELKLGFSSDPAQRLATSAREQLLY